MQLAKKVFKNVDNHLESSRFRNYVAVALRCKKTNEAFDFIENYKQYLAEIPDRDDIIRYVSSLVLFQQKDYKKVIENLRFKQFSEEDFHLRSQIIFLKAWFELEESAHHKAGRHTEFDTLKRIEEFEKMVEKTETLSETVQQKFLLVAAAFRQIISVTETARKTYASQAAKDACKTWLLSQNGLLERNWFLEKVREL